MSVSKLKIHNIWMLTREYAGVAGAGGVKDVAKQLSRALSRWKERRVSVVLPLYGFIRQKEVGLVPLVDPLLPKKQVSFEIDMNYTAEDRREKVRVWQVKDARVTVYFLEADRFLEKEDVYTYSQAEEKDDPWKKQGEGHFDYFAMNLLLQKGAIELMILLGEKPDIIHCHDGHTAVLPAIVNESSWLRSYFRQTGTVVTIHNAGKGYHQEVFDLPFAQALTGLPMSVIHQSLLEKTFDPFVAAGAYAVVNTVSENYARELRETTDDQLTGWLGHHLMDMGVRLEGVTNGIDPDEFDTRDVKKVGIKAPYDLLDDLELKGKRLCKIDLIENLQAGLSERGVEQVGEIDVTVNNPLFTFVGRLSHQKGVDVLIGALEHIFRTQTGLNVVVLGSGGVAEEEELIGLAKDKSTRGRLCFLKGFHPGLANRVYAAGDFFLIPSRYEPCGLTDFIAQLFGNLPIVHYVGGLVKVLDGKTGFSYKENSRRALSAAIERAVKSFETPGVVREMQRQAVTQIHKKHTWDKVMKHYLDLYKQAKVMRMAQE